MHPLNDMYDVIQPPYVISFGVCVWGGGGVQVISSNSPRMKQPFVCVFYITNEMQPYNVLYYYQRSTCFGRFFRPSSGAYKAVCAALDSHTFLLSIAGVVGLFQPIHTSDRQQESMTIPRAAHTVL